MSQYSGNEKKYLLEAIESGTLASYYGESEKTKAFEEAFGEMLGAEVSTVVCISNLIGLHVILRALDCTVGDEVIVEPLSPVGAEAVLINNAVPVFADIDPETLTLNPAAIEEKITPRTKAIVVRHTFGLPCSLEQIIQIASKYNLKLVEDASEAIAAGYKGKKVGIRGDAAVFDFGEGNALSIGQGAVCVTKDYDLANWIHRYVCVGRSMGSEIHYDSRKGLVPVENLISRRFRVSELEAAVGLAQMERYEELVSIHLKAAHQTMEACENLSFLRPQRVPHDIVHGYGKIALVYEGERMGVELDRFREALKQENISSVTFNPHPQATYLEPALQEASVYKHHCPIRCPLYKGTVSYRKGICPVAEETAPKLLFIEPSGTKAEAEKKAFKLKKIFQSLQGEK